jgi:glutamyl-tRNA synthetase
VVVRFEDLHGERSRPEHEETTLRDLDTLGLDWDGTPRLQSKGLGHLTSIAERLHRERKAYPCVCTRGDIRGAQSAPQEGVAELRYPGTCRGLYDSLDSARDRSGRGAGLRFAVPHGERTVVDRFAGAHTFNPHEEAGDFLITRRDGQPAYQLAVVVDDVSDGVTEVVRGDDLLASAARQMLLLEALGEVAPDYYHLPLVRDASGRRLAKREDDLSLFELRNRGVDPRAVVGWVARSARIDVAERATASELVSSFSMERVPRESVLLSPEVLGALTSAR